MAENTERLTDAELAEITEREQKATPGPWVASPPSWRRLRGPYRTAITVGPRHTVANALTHAPPDLDSPPAEPGPDAVFIAHARTDIPRLLAEVRALREELAAAIARAHAAEQAREAAEWLVCGSTYQNAEYETRVEDLRAEEGHPVGLGCQRRLRIMYAYRCVDCGRWFCRPCILAHFAENGDERARVIQSLERQQPPPKGGGLCLPPDGPAATPSAG